MPKLELQSQPIFTKFGVFDLVGAFLMTFTAKLSTAAGHLSKVLRSFFAAGHQ